MNSYKLTLMLTVDSNISRTINLPEGISFKKLHEIICIIFNLDDSLKYKFMFEDIGLTIQDTGSLNMDHIDSRHELIDYYLQRYSEIKYVHPFSHMIIRVSKIDTKILYPQFVEFEGKYNPNRDIKSVEEYLNALKGMDKLTGADMLVEININQIQGLLLSLFNIPYAIENNKIVILKYEETLEKFF